MDALKLFSDTCTKLASQNLLSDVDALTISIYAASAFVLVVTVGIVAFRDSKRRAWCITLVNSAIMILAGAVYTVIKFPQFRRIFAFEENDVSIFHGRDDFSVIISCIFGSATLLDLILGFIFYRDKLDIVTSYIHHSLFTWLMFYAVTGNFFGEELSPFTQGYLFMVIEEVPTFILALGSIFPQLRSDIGFGVSFFAFRIMFHVCMTASAIFYNPTDRPIYCVMIISLCMHLNWFYKWWKSFTRKVVLKTKHNLDVESIEPSVRLQKSAYIDTTKID